VVVGVVTTCQARQNEWTKDPPFPESVEKGHGHVLKGGRGVVSRLAKASGSLIHPSQKALGRAEVKMGVVTTCEACQNEWIIDPPFPQNEWIIDPPFPQNEWIIDPPFPESAGKGQEWYKVRTGCEARQNEWISDPPFPESTGKGAMATCWGKRRVWSACWLAKASGSLIHPSQKALGRAKGGGGGGDRMSGSPKRVDQRSTLPRKR